MLKKLKKVVDIEIRTCYIIWATARNGGWNDLWKLSKIMSFVDRIKEKSIL